MTEQPDYTRPSAPWSILLTVLDPTPDQRDVLWDAVAAAVLALEGETGIEVGMSGQPRSDLHDAVDCEQPSQSDPYRQGDNES